MSWKGKNALWSLDTSTRVLRTQLFDQHVGRESLMHFQAAIETNRWTKRVKPELRLHFAQTQTLGVICSERLSRSLKPTGGNGNLFAWSVQRTLEVRPTWEPFSE